MTGTDQTIVAPILAVYPETQVIYRFGSAGSDYERPDSDIDLALLLPPAEAKKAGSLALSALHLELESSLGKAVDLINIRAAATVFQKEIVMGGERIYCSDPGIADEFEMLVLSLYVKLNEERAEILAEGLRSGRFYGP